MISDLFSKSLLFVTGKGGIGKTVVSGVIGLLAARAGKKTLLVESNHQDELGPMFGARVAFHSEVRLGDNLASINLNASENFREYVTKYLGQKMLYDTVFSNRVVKSFINTIPGFAEIMLLGRLFYACRLSSPPRPDLVVFDSYASGHFLSLMTTPDAVMRTRLGGPLIAETQRVRSFLAEQDTVGVVYVVVPESLVVAEALDFLPKLEKESPAKLCAIVINRSLTPVVRENVQALSGASHLAAYLSKQRTMRASAEAELIQGLQSLGGRLANLPLIWLPETGFIPEPLSEEYAVLLARQGEGAHPR